MTTKHIRAAHTFRYEFMLMLDWLMANSEGELEHEENDCVQFEDDPCIYFRSRKPPVNINECGVMLASSTTHNGKMNLWIHGGYEICFKYDYGHCVERNDGWHVEGEELTGWYAHLEPEEHPVRRKKSSRLDWLKACLPRQFTDRIESAHHNGDGFDIKLKPIEQAGPPSRLKPSAGFGDLGFVFA